MELVEGVFCEACHELFCGPFEEFVFPSDEESVDWGLFGVFGQIEAVEHVGSFTRSYGLEAFVLDDDGDDGIDVWVEAWRCCWPH